jgi:hypothetical protein
VLREPLQVHRLACEVGNDLAQVPCRAGPPVQTSHDARIPCPAIFQARVSRGTGVRRPTLLLLEHLVARSQDVELDLEALPNGPDPCLADPRHVPLPQGS